MELSFRTRGMRDYWMEPTLDSLTERELTAAKQLIEDLASAPCAADLSAFYTMECVGNELRVILDDLIQVTCFIDERRVVMSSGNVPDLSRVTRGQVVSVEKIGGVK